MSARRDEPGRERLFLVLAVLSGLSVLTCVTTAFAKEFGPGVLAVPALLVGGVAWLKWREVRGNRAERRLTGTLHEIYSDAVERAERGDLTGATASYERAIERSTRLNGAADPFTIELIGNLAAVRLALGDLAVSEELRERAYQACRADLGDDAVDTLSALNGVASVLLARGALPVARERYEAALDGCLRNLDEEHPETAEALNGLARTLAAEDDLAAARERYGQAVERCTRTLGPSHPDTLAAARCLAVLPAEPSDAVPGAALLLACGDLGGARRLYEQAVDACERRHGEIDLRTAAVLTDLAAVLRDQRDLQAAIRCYLRAQEICARIPAGPHAEAVAAGNGLARVYLLLGAAGNAVDILTEVLAATRQLRGDEHPDTLATQAHLAWARRQAGITPTERDAILSS